MAAGEVGGESGDSRATTAECKAGSAGCGLGDCGGDCGVGRGAVDTRGVELDVKSWR